MDPQSYQQMMVQALMGGLASPGVMQNNQSPVTGYGQSFLTGNPTTTGGMLGSSSYQTVNPMSQQSMAMPGQPNPNQLQQQYQQYPGMSQDHADGNAGSQ